MPIETFGYPDSLNASYPPTSDGLVGGDDHIRGIKATIKNTFPNVTGAISGTQAQLNGLVGWYTDGATLLASAGAMFKANPTDGLKNPLAGVIDLYLQGSIAATFTRTGGYNFIALNGKVTATEFAGLGTVPVGGTMIWWTDTAPTGYAFANGQAVSRADNPVLYGLLGTTHGAGNGTTTFNLPNLQEVVPVGKSGMGGATAPGLLTSIATGVKNVLNAIFGSDTHTLTTAQIPAHSHANTATVNDPGHTHNYNGPAVNVSGAANSPSYGTYTNQQVSAATTGITVTINNVNAGGGGAHNNLQPSKVVNWIIRLG